MNRSSRLLVIVLGAGAIGAAWYWWRPAPPAPPIPQRLADLDPGLANAIRESFDEADDHRRDPVRRLELGMIYEANGLPEHAADCYQVAVELSPDEARAWYRLAVVSGDLGRIDRALTAGHRTIELAPDYAPAHWRVGRWLLHTGRLGEAESAFRESVTVDSNAAAGWFGLALVAMERENAGRTIEIIEQHLLRSQAAPRAYQLLGRAYLAQGRHVDAQRVMALAGSGAVTWKDPWTAEIQRYQRGQAARRVQAERLFHGGDYARAQPLLEKLAQQADDDWQLLTLLGITYSRTGQPARCADTMHKALAVNPDNDTAHYYLALAAGDADYATEADFARALFHVNRAIELNRNSSDAYRLKGALFAHRGDFERALTAYREGYRADARDLALPVFAGFAECELQRWSDALTTFEDVLQRDPTQGDAHVGRARALMELGSLDEADRALRRAEELDRVNRARAAETESRLTELRGNSPR